VFEQFTIRIDVGHATEAALCKRSWGRSKGDRSIFSNGAFRMEFTVEERLERANADGSQIQGQRHSWVLGVISLNRRIFHSISLRVCPIDSSSLSILGIFAFWLVLCQVNCKIDVIRPLLLHVHIFIPGLAQILKSKRANYPNPELPNQNPTWLR